MFVIKGKLFDVIDVMKKERFRNLVVLFIILSL